MSTLNILATDQLQTPLSLLGTGGQLRSAYTPYGYRPAQSPSPLLGFTGQLHERELGWYLLGNGYRAYNPVLMRFHSPDRYSPFGRGGINAYAYCEGDPVGFRDPSGKFGEAVRKMSFFNLDDIPSWTPTAASAGVSTLAAGVNFYSMIRDPKQGTTTDGVFTVGEVLFGLVGAATAVEQGKGQKGADGFANALTIATAAWLGKNLTYKLGQKVGAAYRASRDRRAGLQGGQTNGLWRSLESLTRLFTPVDPNPPHVFFANDMPNRTERGELIHLNPQNMATIRRGSSSRIDLDRLDESG